MAVKKGGAKNKRRLAPAVRAKTQRLRAQRAASPQAPHADPATAGPRKPGSAFPFADEVVADTAGEQQSKLPSVMLVITILAVLYLGFLTWQVAQMPAR
ncbi:MAG: hypothetical protein HYR56_19100 [Acidobacteria bacterium]|nr:hypothetical protein [Acidobacteriota bacterium]MBI3426719.1 hypothetical protein [Acidobacteriota bacterium]